MNLKKQQTPQSRTLFGAPRQSGTGSTMSSLTFRSTITTTLVGLISSLVSRWFSTVSHLFQALSMASLTPCCWVRASSLTRTPSFSTKLNGVRFKLVTSTRFQWRTSATLWISGSTSIHLVTPNSSATGTRLKTTTESIAKSMKTRNWRLSA